jgi:hypothetical protein
LPEARLRELLDPLALTQGKFAVESVVAVDW